MDLDDSTDEASETYISPGPGLDTGLYTVVIVPVPFAVNPKAWLLGLISTLWGVVDVLIKLPLNSPESVTVTVWAAAAAIAVLAIWLVFVVAGLPAADESESSVPDNAAAVPGPAAHEFGECPVALAPMSGPRLLTEALEWAPCPL